ncbi:MAG TPA: UDP-N-acetylglucosamine 1-carboxyvinyltransferase, partial [Kofleriaceae bacterium]|nr:UDP-N-acetylglucosamine 1-carboxyvinyltransferase [Kofleriaceae bacterium]
MDKIVVEGGSRLVGKIPISGAKNAALPLLAAALLPGGTSTWKNVPQLADVRTMAKLLRMLGWNVDPVGETALQIAAPTQENLKLEAPYDLVKTMRASVLVLGPLVAR